MPKRRRRRGLRPEWRPDCARPLMPEAFRTAMINTLTALTTPHPELHERVTPHMVMHDEDETSEIWLQDTPTNRVLMTLCDHYEDHADYRNASWRFWALQALMDRPELAPWLAAHPKGGYEIADAVFYVAATAPMNARGEFWMKPFCAALERWAAEHPEADPEEEEP